jgi:hypothetical protein
MLRNFATVRRSLGRAGWWRTFVTATAEQATATTISVELEDPFVAAADSSLEVPRLAGTLRELAAERGGTT